MKGTEWYQDKKARKDDVIKISKDIINQKIDFLLGVREISELYGAIESEYDCTSKLFSTFIALDEKTFHIPPQEEQGRFSNDFLIKSNHEKLQFETEFRDLINIKCENLIQHFSKFT